MSAPIQGRVARILNSRELAINKGANDGVEIGMFFDVLDAKGESIEDPETGEPLGSVPRPKVRLKVTLVQDKLSVASTYKTKRVNVGGSGANLNPFADLLMPPKWVQRYETLRTQEKTWEDLDEKESYVKIGDPVIQVIEDLSDPPQDPAKPSAPTSA